MNWTVHHAIKRFGCGSLGGPVSSGEMMEAWLRAALCPTRSIWILSEFTASRRCEIPSPFLFHDQSTR